MVIIIVFCLALIVIALIVYFLIKMCRIREFRLNFKEGLLFIREDIPDLNLSLGNYIGIVASQDGQTRKIHLNLVIRSNVDQVIDNFQIILNKRIKLRLKQFYQTSATAIRMPDQSIELPLSLSCNQSLNLRAEFETFEYTTFELRTGANFLKLYFQTHNRKAVKKFKINHSKNNQMALDQAKTAAINNKQANVINIPIIFI